ncbi:tRNA lysidine(34) synthetase TilS [Candidatus Pelagibacter sp. HIMB1495]|uniref:tRNA lysidine(34) synthetase TilS n=1 Tax=unclassified Candidatus Pelagibacter TaxID=2647897 RepID=UPI003F84712D
MSLKNLNASSKIHKQLLNKLRDKRIYKIYNKFEKNLNLNNNFTVAVSGGSDSLALAFFSKIYSIKKSLKIKYFLVDHKLRNNSSVEALFVKNLLKDFSIDLDILKWNGKKPKNNIQSLARKKRYNLLINQSKKFKIDHILLGHHEDDVYENFLIRLIRGSGLKGIVSLDKTTLINNVNILRPLINVEKKDLIYISKKVFNKYVEDPSNEDKIFTRVRIRNLIKNLESEGLDKSKFKLSIYNLKSVDQSIQFFCEKNLRENSIISQNKVVLKEEFFKFPQEVLFRSFSKILQLVGKKYFPPRGKKIINILENLESKTSFKSTLGNCVIKKINRTVIVQKER